jgi:hypothetical protein
MALHVTAVTRYSGIVVKMKFYRGLARVFSTRAIENSIYYFAALHHKLYL